MDFASSQDSFIQLGFWAANGAFAIVLLLIVYIIGYRLIQSFHSRNNNAFHKQWRPILASCSLDKPENIPTLKKRDQISFLLLWNHYFEVLKGQAVENLISLARQVRLAEISRQQLYRHNKKVKLLGILTLGRLRSRTDWPLLNQFIHLPDTYLSLVSMRACFKIHQQRAVETLLPYLITRTDYPPAQVGYLLRNTENKDICTQLNLHMMLNLSNGSNNILRYMELCGCEINRKVLQIIIDKNLDDQVISTALGIINDPAALDLILSFTKHPRWHIRVHAATALGRLGRREQLPNLMELLEDSQWWVRYRAAQALVNLPFMNKDELTKLQSSLDDRYARDMLGQAMAETTR